VNFNDSITGALLGAAPLSTSGAAAASFQLQTIRLSRCAREIPDFTAQRVARIDYDHYSECGIVGSEFLAPHDRDRIGANLTTQNHRRQSAASLPARRRLVHCDGPFRSRARGAGFDNAGTVTVVIKGQTFTRFYFGAQGAHSGLDQINVLFPESLADAGQVDISITVDGQLSNAGARCSAPPARIRVRFSASDDREIA
jgi:hypothetical protein